MNIGNLGTGTLTIADGGVVTAPTVVIATNAGSIGTLNIGAGAGSPAAAPGTLNAPSVAFGAGTGTINFNHTSADYVFAPAISGNGTVNVLAGTTTLTGANTYSGATNVNRGHVAGRRAEHVQPEFGSDGRERRNARSQRLQSDRPQRHQCRLGEHGHGHCAGHGLDDDQLHRDWRNDRDEHLSGGDGSPSDKLVINGGSATGNSFLRITNAGGPGAETVANGIAVVQAINGGTTAPGAFALAGEVRGGAFDYDLFRGGLGGSSPNDWFLRSTFIVGPPTEPPILPPILAARAAAAAAAAGRLSDHRAGDRDLRRGSTDRPAIGDDDARHLA